MKLIDRAIMVAVVVLVVVAGRVIAQSATDGYSREREMRALESIAASLKKIEKCGP